MISLPIWKMYIVPEMNQLYASYTFQRRSIISEIWQSRRNNRNDFAPPKMTKTGETIEFVCKSRPYVNRNIFSFPLIKNL